MNCFAFGLALPCATHAVRSAIRTSADCEAIIHNSLKPSKMNTLKHTALFLLMSISLFKLEAQQIWSFDQANPLQANNSVQLTLHSIREPELTDGIVGKALRTDGYTTWLSTQFDTPRHINGISAWFALESFPTDTAAFFGLRNKQNKETLTLGTNMFGKLLIGTVVNGNFIYLPVTYTVKRFEWLNLMLTIHKGRLALYVNGNEINIDQSAKVDAVVFDELIVGKDFRDKKLGIHDLTAINGLIDDITIWDTPIDIKTRQTEIGQLSHKVPILAIPKSRFANDFSRPKYHLLPSANWTNETHGLIYYRNSYHIFNQKNASNLFLGQINWGHFSSPDLINWTEHKPALTPEPQYDAMGIWSGHVVIDHNIPTIIYTTGDAKMGIGIAFPKDSTLIDWVKYENNPVVHGQPKAYTRTDLRDPYVWKEANNWYMAVGFGIKDHQSERGALLLYRSVDLRKWDFLHTLYEGTPEIDNSGIFWEMPVFKKIGDQYVLLINKVPHKGVPAKAMYWVGKFIDERFIPNNAIPQNLEIVNRLLSPSITEDKDGLITAIAIIPDEIGSQAAYQQGWTHLYSIPRVWNLKDGSIKQSPHPALATLRGKHEAIGLSKVTESKPLLINKDQHQLEVKVNIKPNGSKKFGFVMAKNQNLSEYTRIYYDVDQKEFIVDQTHSSLKQGIPLRVRKGAYNLDLTQPIELRVFIDGSVVEVFVNNEDAFTTRIFPLKETSTMLEFFVEGGSLDVDGELWILNSANMKADF
nr:putative GH32 family protein a [Micropterna sequax]